MKEFQRESVEGTQGGAGIVETALVIKRAKISDAI